MSHATCPKPKMERACSKAHASDLLVDNVRTYLAIRSAYENCESDVQQAIDSMVEIYNSPDSTDEEKKRATYTIFDALFPSAAVDFVAFCDGLQRDDRDGRNEEMIQEEAVFADRLQAALKKKGWTQERLAEATGVGQSAVSNMINRQCRPQQRTVARMAEALGVSPEDLWPEKKR